MHLGVAQCTEQNGPKPQVLRGDCGSFAFNFSAGGSKGGGQSLAKIPLVWYAEAGIRGAMSSCSEPAHRQVFLGLTQGSEFNP